MADTLTDARTLPFAWFDKTIVETYAPKIGADALAVYMALISYADREQRCFPSYQTLANTVKLSRPTVVKAIAILKDAGLISVEHRQDTYGDPTSNVYTILDAKGGKARLPPSKSPLPQVVKEIDQGGKGDLHEQEVINEKKFNNSFAPLSEQQAVFGAVAEVCKLDPALNAKSIGSAASKLVKGRYSAADVRVFGEWWVSDRWRKEHTPVPKTSDLIGKIFQAKEWADRRNGQSVDRNDWMDDPQVVAARRARGEI